MKCMLLVIFFLHTIVSFDYNQYLGTKSSYKPPVDWSYQIPPNTCPKDIKEANLYNFVARHGSRNPTSGDVKKLLELQKTLEQNQAQIKNANFSWMKEWQSPYTEATAGILDLAGLQEHYNMSKRVQTRFNVFSQLSGPHYLNSQYPIQTTQVPRAARSGNAWGIGFMEGRSQGMGLGDVLPFFQYSDSANEDFRLRFFDNCPVYQKMVLDQKSFWEQESDLYLENNIQAIKTKVQAKLQTEWDISTDIIKYFWKACAFDISRANDDQHFCAVFDEEDSKVFEYVSDLSDYWLKGYGNEINYQIACPLLKDFFQYFDDVIVEGLTPKAALRFGHAETILPFTALLGLYKDDFVLRANSSAEQIQGRQWRSSQISPFAANYAFILLNCSDAWRISLFHNERQVAIPGCSDIYCPYEELKTLWAAPLSCDFNDLCGITPANTTCVTDELKPGEKVEILQTLVIIFAIALFALCFGAILFSLWKSSKSRFTQKVTQDPHSMIPLENSILDQ